MGQFVNGLREDIRAEVRMLGLHSLEQAMELALKVEETSRLRVARQGGDKTQSLNSFKSNITQQLFSAPVKSSTQSYTTPYSPNSSSSPSWSTNSGTGSSSPNPWSPTLSHTNHSNSQTTKSVKSFIPTAKPLGEVRRLTDKELLYKRERGLCFRCDDKWVAGHRCKRRELSVLLAQEDEQEENLGLEQTPVIEEEVVETTAVEVSLNSVVGLTTPKTMKMVGKINDSYVRPWRNS